MKNKEKEIAIKTQDYNERFHASEGQRVAEPIS